MLWGGSNKLLRTKLYFTSKVRVHTAQLLSSHTTKPGKMGIMLSRFLKSALVLAVVLGGVLPPLVVIGILLSLCLPVLPTKTYNKVAAFLQNQFLLAFVWLYERNHSGLNIYVSGDKIPPNESALIISNHVASHGDWAPIYSLVARESSTSLGGFKVVIKDIVKWIPGFGWCMWLLNWPFLKRNWAGDKAYLEKKLKSYAKDDVPLQLLIFPEGTRFTKKKHAAAVAYAKERKLHVPVHTMIPRYKGFQALVRGLDGVATHIYDVTLAYNGFHDQEYEKGTGYFNLYTHEVSEGNEICEMHMHVRRLKLADLPEDDAKLKELLFKWFEKKDAMLHLFYSSKNKRFEGAKKLAPLPASQWIPALSLMIAMSSLCGHVFMIGMHSWW